MRSFLILMAVLFNFCVASSQVNAAGAELDNLQDMTVDEIVNKACSKIAPWRIAAQNACKEQQKEYFHHIQKLLEAYGEAGYKDANEIYRKCTVFNQLQTYSCVKQRVVRRLKTEHLKNK